MNTPRLVLTVVRSIRLRRAAISSFTSLAAGLLEQACPRVAVHALREAVYRLALLRRERLRDIDHKPVVDVAPGLAAQPGRPLAAQPLDGPVLGAPRDAQALGPPQRGNLDHRPSNGLRDREGDLDLEVVACPPEPR